MSDPGKAVFLSYASQDAEAAKRICDALRAAGVEVWFDQSELVGGDAWDQKIRKQIKDCALLIPIISANTQSRTEGYFRLEWRLADQRTHLMAKGRPFLLPVVIDDTHDTEAAVPDSFLDVQWTKAPGGVVSPVFVERVRRLLTVGEPVLLRGREARAAAPGSAPAEPGPAKSPARPWLVPVMGVAAAAAAIAGWFAFRPGAGPVSAASGAKAAVTIGHSELAQLQARIIPDRWQKGDFEAVSATLDRLIAANPEDAEAWALRSVSHSLQVLRILDPGTKTLEAGKAAAEQALRLAPESPLADLAMGLHLLAMISRGGDPQACRGFIERAVAGMPPDPLTRFADLLSHWLPYDFDGTERSALAWLQVEPKATYPAWILTSMNVTRRRPAEVEKWAEQAKGDQQLTGARAFANLTDISFYLRADLALARTDIDRVPVQLRMVPRVLHWRWLLAMAERKWDGALQELAQMPDPFIYDSSYNGPKALLAGLAHQRAGRAEPAAAQFREAERLLREKLAGDPDNEALRAGLALTLACAGRSAEARTELAAVEPLVAGRAPNVYRGRLVVSLAQTYGALGDYAAMAPWVRRLFAEPSGVPLTPASFRLDPRFNAAANAPEIQALLKEFASLDQPGTQRTEDGGQASHGAGRATGPGLAEASIGTTAGRAEPATVPSPSSLHPAPANPPLADSKSVAVLAFANLSDDKANEYFSDGISEELLNVLAKVPGLKVSARTSAFSFKDKPATAQEIGEKLGVATLVEGSVRKAGNQVRITARLSRVATGEQLWSESYTRELQDVFAVQTELAQAIVVALRAKLMGETGTAIRSEVASQVATAQHGGTTNVEAHELYLQGRYFMNQPSLGNIDKAVGYFQRAVEADKSFALAWAALGRTTALQAEYLITTPEDLRERFARARRAVDRALNLDPNLADGYFARLEIQTAYDYDWVGSRESLDRALALAPSDPLVISNVSQLEAQFGDFEKSIRLGRQATELDPVNAEIRYWLGRVYISAGRLPEAEAELRRAAELSPGILSIHRQQSVLLVLQGRFEDAVAEARLEGSEWSRQAALAVACWAAKDVRGADAALARLIEVAADSAGYQVAEAYAFRGEADHAFEWLENAYRNRDSGLGWTRVDPLLKNLWNDPRWPAFVRKAGLADDQLK